jgi:hypothetical protein
MDVSRENVDEEEEERRSQAVQYLGSSTMRLHVNHGQPSFSPTSVLHSVSATCGCRLSRREGAETDEWRMRTVLVKAQGWQ